MEEKGKERLISILSMMKADLIGFEEGDWEHTTGGFDANIEYCQEAINILKENK